MEMTKSLLEILRDIMYMAELDPDSVDPETVSETFSDPGHPSWSIVLLEHILKAKQEEKIHNILEEITISYTIHQDAADKANIGEFSVN